MIKKFLIITLLSLSGFSQLFAKDEKDLKEYIWNSEFSFLSFKDVINAYAGKWTGNERLFIKGSFLMSFDIENSYVKLGNYKLIGTGFVTSKGLPIQISSVMSVEDGKLMLTIQSADSSLVAYEAIISDSKVRWVRDRKIYMYESSEDSFINNKDTIEIESYSIRPYVSKRGGSFLESFSKLKKEKPSQISSESQNVKDESSSTKVPAIKSVKPIDLSKIHL